MPTIAGLLSSLGSLSSHANFSPYMICHFLSFLVCSCQSFIVPSALTVTRNDDNWRRKVTRIVRIEFFVVEDQSTEEQFKILLKFYLPKYL